MDAQSLIARRVALELRSCDLVNLGIGIPTLVANYVPPELKVFFQSENGLIGTGPIPEQGLAHPLLTDAGDVNIVSSWLKSSSVVISTSAAPAALSAPWRITGPNNSRIDPLVKKPLPRIR